MLNFIARYWDGYLIGLAVGVAISAASMAMSIVIGTITALGRTGSSTSGRIVAGAYVGAFRAVPPLVTLYFVYFGLPVWAQDAGIPLLADLFAPLNNRILAAIVATTLTSGAYSAEIIRGGIAAIPEEQVEAAKSIGMSVRQTFIRVIAPQAFRVAFPSLGNEYIYLLKGTSLASVIGVVELMRTAQLAAGATFLHLLAYSMAAIYYIAFVAFLQFALGRMEKRFPGHQKAQRHALPLGPAAGGR
jgi:His/Glu/Gln/Arg/opine family amino acid ABC transporter permease subunit